jgi:hypothetical protein
MVHSGLYGPDGTLLAPATMPARPQICRFDETTDGSVLAGEILHQTPTGYLIQAASFVEGQLVPDDGHWLMVPWDCDALRGDLPRDWEKTELEFLEFLFGSDASAWPPLMWYYLHGCEMGRTVFHSHGHIVRWRPGMSGVGQWTLEAKYSAALEQLEELHQLVAASCADAQEALRALEAGGVADAKAILSRLLGRPVPATTV